MRPLQPLSSATLAISTASFVVSAETAAITGTLLPTAVAQVLKTCAFSEMVREPPSPSEPQATIPVHPSSTNQAACRARKVWSTEPCSLNGVVMAGITPDQARCEADWLM